MHEYFTEFILKFLRRNPSALFADLVIFSTCCFKFRSFVIVTPRHLACVTVAINGKKRVKTCRFHDFSTYERATFYVSIS